jgi:HD-GYP domain-containing protein (c-di-GMP phosphodiesterase class II)
MEDRQSESNQDAMTNLHHEHGDASRSWGDPCRTKIAHSLSCALGARHSPIVSHSARVATTARALAERLDWSRTEAIRLFEAACLHDIGMLGVPDSVFFKPTPLTADERRLFEEHPGLSSWISGELLDLEQRSWVRGHHERWDGGGYPDGLSGDAIPLGARILAVAEVWDELTWPPYGGLDAARALQECEAGTGSRFSPEIVTALTALEQERRDQEGQ